MKRVFLSFNQDRDQAFVNLLKQRLKASSDYQLFDSSGLPIGRDVALQVRSQIQRASLVVVLYSSGSNYLLLETGMALGAGKPVIIVGGKPESLPSEIQSLPYIPTSGELETDVENLVMRLDSLRLEEERPQAQYRTVAEKLRTYFDDPAYFESIPAAEFEELIFQWLAQNGFEPTRPKDHGMYGIDLVAQSPVDRSLIVVETKKSSRQSRVSITDTMALLGAATLFKAQTAILITSSSFTTAALKMAGESQYPHVRLLTIEDLLSTPNPGSLVR